MSIWYCTREDVKGALDMAESARANATVDRLIAASSRTIDGHQLGGGLTHRRWYPELATRYFAWPDEQMGRSWRLWLGSSEVLSVSSITSAGRPITDYFLEPQRSGPPYNRLELDLAGPDLFDVATTHQRTIAITGVFGACNDETPAGQLDATTGAADPTIAVTDSAAVGIGSLLRIGGERLIVRGKRLRPTGQQLDTAVTAQLSAGGLAVADGTAFALGEVVTVGTERMLIEDIAADTLIVKRGQDGSTLAAHEAGSPIYAPRQLSVTRGVLGTTAGSHIGGAAVHVHQVPGPIRSLAIAETLWALQMEGSGYARVVGSGDGARQVSARGLQDLRNQVYAGFARKARKGVV